MALAGINAPHTADSLRGLLSTEPARPRRAFALTPLADIMFQLLIFFMLSTSLSPYALLAVTSRGAPPEGATAAAPAPAVPPPAPAIWNLGRGELRSGRETIPVEALGEALAQLQEEAVDEILLFVTDTARTQDLVTVMDEVRQAGFARLRLMNQ